MILKISIAIIAALLLFMLFEELVPMDTWQYFFSWESFVNNFNEVVFKIPPPDESTMA